MSASTFTAVPVSAPHTYITVGISRVMLWVMAALAPATLYGFWLFGWPAIHLWCITVLATMLGEGFCLRLAGRKALPILFDGSALLTGWLLAMSLPPWAPWWVGVFGGMFASVFGKQIFGGLGQNPFNPAMVARVALLISFPVPMTLWVAPLPITAAAAPGFIDGLQITLNGFANMDAIASASVLGYAKTELTRGVDLLHSLAAQVAPHGSATGYRQGSLGETSAMLLALGGFVLLGLRIITWHIPAAMLAGIAIPALILHQVDPARYLDAGTHVLCGAAIMGAFFIATDYVTSPNTPAGQIVFGLGVGLLTYIIRTWGGYPEGVAFAILLMNTLTPVIDRLIKPRIYGRNRRGVALEPDRVK
jgi:electron transport complex protein RnfD/electron transport complex protein RnfC